MDTIMTILGNFLHMSMKKNKRRTLLFIGLVVILLSGMWWSYYYAEKRNRYCLEVIKLDKDQGYGYTIKQGKQTVIYQPFVPVLSQRKPFKTPDEAAKVGDLVLERLESGQDFSVTEEDLKSLGIKK